MVYAARTQPACCQSHDQPICRCVCLRMRSPCCSRRRLGPPQRARGPGVQRSDRWIGQVVGPSTRCSRRECFICLRVHRALVREFDRKPGLLRQTCGGPKGLLGKHLFKLQYGCRCPLTSFHVLPESGKTGVLPLPTNPSRCRRARSHLLVACLLSSSQRSVCLFEYDMPDDGLMSNTVSYQKTTDPDWLVVSV